MINKFRPKKWYNLKMDNEVYKFYTYGKLELRNNEIINNTDKTVFLHAQEKFKFGGIYKNNVKNGNYLIFKNIYHSTAINSTFEAYNMVDVVIQVSVGKKINTELNIFELALPEEEKKDIILEGMLFLANKKTNQFFMSCISGLFTILELDKYNNDYAKLLNQNQYKTIFLDANMLTAFELSDIFLEVVRRKLHICIFTNKLEHVNVINKFSKNVVQVFTPIDRSIFVNKHRVLCFDISKYSNDPILINETTRINEISSDSASIFLKRINDLGLVKEPYFDVTIRTTFSTYMDAFICNKIVASNDNINIGLLSEYKFPSLIPSLVKNTYTNKLQNVTNIDIDTNHIVIGSLEFFNHALKINDVISYEPYKNKYSDFERNNFGLTEINQVALSKFNNLDEKIYNKGSTIFYLIDRLPSKNDQYANYFSLLQIKSLEKRGYFVIPVVINNNDSIYSFEGEVIYRLSSKTFKEIISQFKNANIMVGFYNEKCEPYIDDVEANVIISTLGVEVNTLFDRSFLLDDENLDISYERLNAIFENRLNSGLRKIIDENYTYTFPSDFLRMIYVKNVGNLPKKSYNLVTPIDNERFNIDNQRDKIDKIKVCSISSYSSNVYANDIIIDGIIKLSKYEEFDKFEFTVVGEGKDFKKIVYPLKSLNFPNVKIINRFLSADEIQEIHRENDVYLNFKRTDSQGVSRMEAMASALCVIENDLPTVSEFSESNTSVVIPLNAEALKNSLLHLKVDKIKSIGRNAAKYIYNNHSFDNIVYPDIFLKSKCSEELVLEESSKVLAKNSNIYTNVNYKFIDKDSNDTIVVFVPWTGNVDISVNEKNEILYSKDFINQIQFQKNYCWYYNTFRQLNANLLFVMDTQNVYQGWNAVHNGEIIIDVTCKKINDILVQKNLDKKNVVFYGSSKGGYIAALLGQNIECVNEIVITNAQLSLKYFEQKTPISPILLLKNKYTTSILDQYMFFPKYKKNVHFFGLLGNKFDEEQYNLLPKLSKAKIIDKTINDPSISHSDFVPKYIEDIVSYLKNSILTEEIREEFTIVGSCVSRDMFTINSVDHLLGKYYSRITLPSFMSAKANIDVSINNEASTYIERNINENLNKNFIIETSKVIVDLIEFRFVDLYDNDENLFTLSSFVTQYTNTDYKNFKHINYLKEENFNLVMDSIVQFIKKYSDKKIYLILPHLAKIDENGEQITYNYSHEMLELLLTKVGLELQKVDFENLVIITPPNNYTVADSKHKWGIAPFHYVDEFYEYVFSEIRRNDEN